ncbi:MAG: hypothetical protein U1E70_25820 [Acetobacteraceae bacterium]
MKSRALFVAAVALLAAVCFTVALRGADFFEDDLYNTGTILRSAAAKTGPLLQTSIAAAYYAQYPVVRAEDWHRSLSMLIASASVRLTGSSTVIGVLHCGYLATFGTLMFLLIRRAASDGPSPVDAERTGLRANWIALATIAAVIASPYGLLILSRTATDDIPSGCLVLAGLWLVLRSEFPTARAAAAAGVFFGAAFWAKDLCLLWTGLGSLILLVGLLRGRPRLTIGRLVIAALPGLCAAVVAGGKLLWNHADLGTFLPSLALTENRIFIFGRFTGFDPHFPYYLRGDARLDSAVALAGGVLPAIKAVIALQLPGLHALADEFAPVLPLLIAALLIPRQFTAERPFLGRLGRAVVTILAVYLVFCLTGASTVDQPRYWIVPVGLACGLGLIFLLDVWRRMAFTVPRLRALAGAVVYAVSVYQFPSAYFGLRKAPLIPPSVVAWVQEALAKGSPEDTVALNGRRAFYYYGLTGDRVVTIWPAALNALTPDDERRWLSDYHVRWAVLQDSDTATRVALERIGFTVAHQDAGYLMLQPAR